MIVDTSAIVAILTDEPAANALIDAILQADEVWISAATLVDLYAVLDRRSTPEQRRQLDALLEQLGIQTAAFTAEHAAIAREAYRDFGRGSGHRAGLNLGDCFSYALATARRAPLLYVGQDFGHTDVRAAFEA